MQAQAEGALVQEDAEKRPPGQKKAKEALKRGGGEACMVALDKMWAKKEKEKKERRKIPGFTRAREESSVLREEKG